MTIARVSSAPPRPLTVNGDAARLVQVVGNLLNNAMKFTGAGGNVTATLVQQDGAAVLTVKDTGIGIAAQDLPRLFEMFVQVDSSVTRAHGGLGIGLMLVKFIVERHGGSTAVHSDGLGRGSEFDVRIPLTNVVGDVGEGWSVAMATLSFERGTAFTANQVRLAKILEDLIDYARDHVGPDGRVDGKARDLVNLRDGQGLNKGQFFAARFARLYPLYFVMLVAATPKLLAWEVQRHGMKAGMIKTAEIFAANVAMTQVWYPSRLLRINTPTWSLCA